jgi:hypothetical protein
LLDDDTMKRTKHIGTALIRELQQPAGEIQLAVSDNACLQCGTPFFMLRENNQVECQLCQARGEIHQKGENMTITWTSKGGKNRWSPEAMAEHFSEWVLRTGPVYQKNREEIQKQFPKYSKIPIISGP